MKTIPFDLPSQPYDYELRMYIFNLWRLGLLDLDTIYKLCEHCYTRGVDSVYDYD